jgi:tRNA A37 threonylcarbamoyladenosine dehydratase
MERFSRTIALLGEHNFEKIQKANVIVFGVGGVGGYVAEGLARCGVGNITVVDKDVVSLSNINRQIIALTSTVGRKKTELIKERIFDINPNCKVTVFDMFYLPENADSITLSDYSFVVDAIDTVSAKLDIITKCATLNIPIISCMGTANHTDPTSFKIVDVYETDVCPLARVMRRECKKRNIPKGKVKVLFSAEQPHKVFAEDGEKLAPCSTVFCPATAGLLIADNVIKTLIR